VARSYSENLGVLISNGNGTFQSIASLGITTTYSVIATADVNRDGKADIAASTYYGETNIYLGNGNGTFQNPTATYTGPYGAAALFFEDLNGDGFLDLITSSSYYGLSFLNGNGDGTFQTPGASLSLPYSAQRPVISDFNGDGQPDLAYANNDYYSGKVSVRLGGCADLTITKTHSGTFIGGQNGLYTLTVKNLGGNSFGTVTVTDQLPAGLTATYMYGYGWNCNLSTVTCTRNDSLSGGGTWDSISITVSISSSAGTSVVNTATVSGGADSNLTNNTASDPTTIVQAPDLILTVGHSGNFASGQTGKTFSIIVGNVGSAPTSGMVRVDAQVSASLIYTGISGNGWNCDYASRSCTRNDALGVTASYPPIIVSVDVSPFAAYNAINYASVSTTGEQITYNNSAYDTVNVLTIPAGLVATAATTTQVNLAWYGVQYATHYEVLRSANNGAFTVVGSPVSPVFIDTSVSPNTVYLYRVRAADASVTGLMGNVDFATTVAFSDEPPVARSTKVKAAHINELRSAVNLMRAAAGFGPATFTDPSLNGVRIKAIHFLELKYAIDSMRTSLGALPFTYGESVAAGSKMKALHIRDLRNAVK